MVISQKLLTRYRELKKEAPGCLLLMQVQVSMQVLDGDAQIVSKVSGLKLPMAGAVDDPAVIVGFPRSGLDTYIGKLARADHS